MINNECVRCQEKLCGKRLKMSLSLCCVPPPPVMRGNNVLLPVPGTHSDKKTRAKDKICGVVPLSPSSSSNGYMVLVKLN